MWGSCIGYRCHSIDAQSVRETMVEVGRQFPAFGPQATVVAHRAVVPSVTGRLSPPTSMSFVSRLYQSKVTPNLLLKNRKVNTEVQRFDLLPANVTVHQRRSSNKGSLLPLPPSQVDCPPSIQTYTMYWIPSGHRCYPKMPSTYRKPQDVLNGFHEFLTGKYPTGGERREPFPFQMIGEFG